MIPPGLFLLIIAVGIVAGLFVGFTFRKPGKTESARNGNDQLKLEKERIRAKDRADTRAMIERLAEKKLDMVKDAIAMGYSEKQLERLDERLEGLIGPEQLQAMIQQLEGGGLPDADIEGDQQGSRPGQSGQITE